VAASVPLCCKAFCEEPSVDAATGCWCCCCSVSASSSTVCKYICAKYVSYSCSVVHMLTTGSQQTCLVMIATKMMCPVHEGLLMAPVSRQSLEHSRLLNDWSMQQQMRATNRRWVPYTHLSGKGIPSTAAHVETTFQSCAATGLWATGGSMLCIVMTKSG